MPQMRNGRMAGYVAVSWWHWAVRAEICRRCGPHAVAGGFPVESALQAAGEGNGIAGGALRYGLGGPPQRMQGR